MQDAWDFILLFIQLPLCLWLINYLSKTVDKDLQYHFKLGLILKLAACILLGFIYQYYYGYGDTLNYFAHSKFLTGAIIDSPQNAISYLFAGEDKFYNYFSYYIDQIYDGEDYFSLENTVVIKIAAVFNLISFNNFFGTGFIFCFFSYWGLWKMFMVFYRAYPDIKEKFVLCLYIPSVVFWGSGILKDSICIGCIGLIVYMCDTLASNWKYFLFKIIGIAVCCALVFVIKAYIIICLIIPLILWRSSIVIIKRGIGFFMVTYLLMGIIALGIIYKIAHVGDYLEFITVNNLYLFLLKVRTAFLNSTNDDNSSFSLGELTPSAIGILQQVPLAINAVLFRPYVWESKKIFSLIAAIESSAFFIISAYVIYKAGIRSTLKTIFLNPDVLFCFLFTILFATSLGMTVSNFGALVRFKIQFLPFSAIGLILIYYKKYGRSNDLLKQ